jgi:hypothetical protein
MSQAEFTADMPRYIIVGAAVLGAIGVAAVVAVLLFALLGRKDRPPQSGERE